MSYKKIVCALCARGDEGIVIKEALKLKNIFGGQITFVHANDVHAGEMSMMMDAPKKITRESIRKNMVSAGLIKENEMVEIKIVVSENIAKAIEKAAAGADLLILGHRIHNTFKDHFFDSVDEGIVNKVKCPILVIPKA